MLRNSGVKMANLKINIRKVAAEADVSVASVSRVLNNRAGVSEEVRERVRKVIEKYSYTPAIATHKRSSIGIIICQESFVVEGFLSLVLSGISRYSFESGSDTATLFVNPARKDSLGEMLRERNCTSAVMVFPQSLIGRLDEIAGSGIPAVLINSDFSGENIVCVSNDSYRGMQDSVEHLISLGHRKIAFLEGPRASHADLLARTDAYLGTMKKYGIDPEKESLLVRHIPTEKTQEAGYLQCRELLKNTQSATAVIANSDEMAYGAMLACSESGLKIPEDISISSFDDLPSSRYLNPPLTTVRQPIESIAYTAAMYAGMMAKDSAAVLKNRIFPTELIIRKSTAKARD